LISRRRWNSVILLVALSFAACGKHGDAADEEKKAEPVPEVTVAKVVRGLIADNLIVNGNLAALPNRDAKVAALVAGRISRVLVIEGDHVTAGQTVAELDSTLLREQERQAEGAVAQAKATVENARITSQREESLLERGVSSRKEVEDARTQLAVAQATLQQQEAGLATARAQVSRSVVRAPFDGTVVKRFAAAGEQVDGTAAQPIVEVAQIDTLELLGTVPAARLQDIRTGEAFTFESNAVPDSKFTARVVSILPAVDPATNNGTVRIRFDNSKHKLKLGQYLSVDLPLKSSGPRLIVPKQAIYPDEAGEPHVYKVTGDESEQVAVQLGIQTKDKAEIVSGVNEGDTVIVIGGYGLPEKSKVHVKQ
jgi:RND family efflux transporter MFP subunit